MAVLEKKPVFKCFLVLDSFALVTSVLAVVLLVYGKASRSAGSWKTFTAALHCLWLSLISMVMAFYAALEAVTSTRAVDISFYVVNYSLFLMLGVVSYLVSPRVSLSTLWKYLWRQGGLRGRHGVVRGRIRQQFPVVGAFVRNLLLFRVANYALLLVGLVTVSQYQHLGDRAARGRQARPTILPCT
ncbi:ankyrin repeat-containing protein [Hordeum vulgare]|nr:ankyrin repeat-containing protein [Hordeum vulgare]